MAVKKPLVIGPFGFEVLQPGDEIDGVGAGSSGLITQTLNVSADGNDTAGFEVLADTTAADVNRTLPAGDSNSVLIYQNVLGANNLNVIPNGAELLNGVNDSIAIPPGGALRFTWYGASVGWRAIVLA